MRLNEIKPGPKATQSTKEGQLIFNHLGHLQQPPSSVSTLDPYSPFTGSQRDLEKTESDCPSSAPKFQELPSHSEQVRGLARPCPTFPPAPTPTVASPTSPPNHSPPGSLCSGDSGLLAVPIRSCLRAFALAAPSAWTAPPSDLLKSFLMRPTLTSSV